MNADARRTRDAADAAARSCVPPLPDVVAADIFLVSTMTDE
jgi:hypothetical protein